ncbi:type VI lipase adapter Tla3 domain-containing protein [Herbaspirillum huttiense]|uniref:type VI lipase adapter Tla3 domain-containing protein n=1 Tax=Herbaspirillum huttiense TaxID=863372 RepID=UPI000584F82A
MANSFRNSALSALGVAVLAYTGSWLWMHRSSNTADGETAQQQLTSAAETHHSGNQIMLAQAGQKFVLEVRGMGVVVDDYTDEEIWQGIEDKADNHATYLSQNPEDYTNSADQRLSNLSAATGFSHSRHARQCRRLPCDPV